MKTLTKTLALFLALTAATAGGQAFADGLAHKSFDWAGRARDVTIPVYIDHTIAGDATTVPVAGQNGVAVVHRLNAATETSSVGTSYVLPYPSRLGIDVRDTSGNSVPVCTGYTVKGTGAAGEYVSEKKSATLSEAAGNVFTDHGFSIVTYFQLTGCSAYDAGLDDYVSLQTSKWLAMPVQVRTASDLISICVASEAPHDTADPLCVHGSALTFHALSNSFDLETASTGFTMVDEDKITYRVVTAKW